MALGTEYVALREDEALLLSCSTAMITFFITQ